MSQNEENFIAFLDELWPREQFLGFMAKNREISWNSKKFREREMQKMFHKFNHFFYRLIFKNCHLKSRRTVHLSHCTVFMTSLLILISDFSRVTCMLEDVYKYGTSSATNSWCSLTYTSHCSLFKIVLSNDHSFSAILASFNSAERFDNPILTREQKLLVGQTTSAISCRACSVFVDVLYCSNS